MKVNANAYPTSESILDAIRQSGKQYEILAHTIYDLPIPCVRTGGDKLPAILITAGAHAGEPAGVLGALDLMENLKTEHATYIVPLRDPFAWNGYARCLEYALGEPVEIKSHEDVEALLTKKGRVVHSEPENNLLISFVGDLVFVSMRPPPKTAGPRDIERRMNRVMNEHPELIPLLAGKRFCWASNLTGIEGCGDFGRAFSAMMTARGVIADFNRQFTYAYPVLEVACLRRFTDRIKPGLILDLHEGQGSKFYLWTSPHPETGIHADVAASIIDAVVKQGGELYHLEELALRIDPEVVKRLQEPKPGLIVGAVHNPLQGASFEAYCQRYGAAYSFEPGRWKSLASRTGEETGGAQAAVSVFEKHYQA